MSEIDLDAIEARADRSWFDGPSFEVEQVVRKDVPALLAALREARERADRAERRVKDLERPTDRELEKSGEEWRRIGNA